MKILQLTAHFAPNVGGVETHLSDLVKSLMKRNWEVFVLTYKPLTTKAKWKMYEKNKNLEILRLPWVAGFFYKLVPYPMLEFFYLLPGLFFVTPFILLIKKPDVIAAHGLVAGMVACFWGKIFRKRVVVAVHSIYHFPRTGLYFSLVSWLFKTADFSLSLSKQSAEEIKSLGVSSDKVRVFTYWIDLDKFNKVKNAKEKLGWKEKFVILFVGRLVSEKGINELLESVKLWDKNITLEVVGTGPLEEKVKQEAKNTVNLKFLGKVENNDLAEYYNAADLLIIPSVSEEGFGRVILESLACGTPVIGSKRGAIPEAMDETVGKLIDVTPENIKKAVEDLYKDRKLLIELSTNARKFAERRYSEKNAEEIIKTYTK